MISIKETLNKELERVKENSHKQVATPTPETGREIKPMAKACNSGKMESLMKVIFLKIKDMVMASTHMKVALTIKDNGHKERKMEKVKLRLKVTISTLVTGKMIRKMEKVSKTGFQNVVGLEMNMRAILIKVIEKVMEFIDIRMEIFMKAHG